MKKYLLAGAAALAFASPAFAGDSVSTVTQEATGNTATVMQTGSGLIATVNQ